MEQLEHSNAALKESNAALREDVDAMKMPIIIPVTNKNSQGSPTIQIGQTSSGHAIEGTPLESLTPNPTVPINAHPDVESAQMYRALEERLKAVEGFSAYGADTLDICLVPDVVIPLKYKVPDFEKYKGIRYPRNHLRMLCRKMAAHATDEKLMIHVFQDSLSGASLDWYMQLERTQIQTWKDLADVFLKQYKYNLDMAPNRMQLQNISQKDNESFKEYAQRCRELAARVQPPLSKKELVDRFMSTLHGPYYEKMIGSISSGFADMVIIGGRVEEGLKSGKIQGSSSNQIGAKKLFNNHHKKKEGETNPVVVGSPQTPSTQMPYFQYPYMVAGAQG
ncbi:gag-protease polyprotein, partial [Trifolium medium]|nr:gag-protease polyprotein [Trifolium medium]